MPANKDFSLRIEILDECLRRRQKKWFIEDMLEEVNRRLEERYEKKISKRTLQYDLDHLINEKQAPIEKKKDGQRVYYRYEDPNYSVLNLPISDEEITFLQDAIKMLRQVNDFKILADVDLIVSKLEHTVAANVADTRTMIQFEKHTTAHGLDYVDDVLTAIKQRLALKISYQPFGNSEPDEWVIHPYLLKEYRNRWFLIGLKDGEKTIINLALDRIVKIKNSPIAYIENELFDPETYYDNLIGVTFPEGEQVQDILIKVYGRQVYYVRTKPIHKTQEIQEISQDGSMMIKLRLLDNYELRSVLLSYGPDIEVIAPLALRDQMQALYKAAVGVYETPLCK